MSANPSNDKSNPRPYNPPPPFNRLWEEMKDSILGEPRSWDLFELRPEGLWYDGKQISSYLEVVAQSCDDRDQHWGKVLRWSHPNGGTHQRYIPASLLVRNGTELIEGLSNAGLSVEYGNNQRVKEYLNTVKPDAVYTNVERTGWHLTKHGRVFVLPEKVITGANNAGANIIFRDDATASGESRMTSKGSLEDWQRNVARLCVGNNLLAFVTSIAFAAPMLEILNESSCGFHLRGLTSVGKSTGLYVGASVWGYEVETWRTTDNAMEALAQQHNHVLLALDELGEFDPTRAAEAIYMLGNNSGKNRLRPELGMQRKLTWRMMWLSSGEVSLAAHAETVGKQLKAGTEVRMIDIDADAGAGMGMFEYIHEYSSPKKFADALLKDLTLKYRGVAGPMWVRYIIECESDAMAYFHKMVEQFNRDVVPEGASPEVARVAHRFGIVAAAGELGL